MSILFPENDIIKESADQPTLYEVDDIPSLRNNIFTKVKDAVINRFPVENERYQIRLDNVDYDSLDPYPKKAQKEALLKRSSLSHKLRGTWKLIDKASGKIVDQKKELIASVPYLTERGTFIRGGNEYTVSNQQRLKPGIYTRKRLTGDYEAHFNVLKGGRPFRVVINPQTAKLSLEVGSAKLHLASVLNKLGVPDQDLKQAWGVDIFNRNSDKDDSGERATHQFRSKDDLASTFASMELDPTVTQQTLGQAFPKVTPESILKATQKLIKISKGEAAEDDRDSIMYQNFLSPDDLLSERITLDSDKLVRSKLLWNSTRKGKLTSQPGYLTRQLDNVFTKSGLAQALEESNPIEAYDNRFRIVRTGEGGISTAGVPDESRSVQPSHFGFIDPVKSPECASKDTEVFTKVGFKFWSDITENDELACNINGRLEFNKPTRLIAQKYNGEMIQFKSHTINIVVTPNHEMYCRPEDKGLKYRKQLAKDINWNRLIPCTHLPFNPIIPIIEFILPSSLTSVKGQQNYLKPIGMLLWAEFLGWYLSEGNTHPALYRVDITQDIKEHPNNVEDIKQILLKLPFKWRFNGKNRFYINNHQLAVYLKIFGKSGDKFIPEYIFEASYEARKKFLDSYFKGDGRTSIKSVNNISKHICTGSEKMANDMLRLLTLQGIAASIHSYTDKRKSTYLTAYDVTLYKRKERLIKPTQITKIQYNDMVYCATVPGGLLYTKIGNSSPVWSGNSGNVGLDNRLSIGVKRDTHGYLYTTLKDKTGKLVPVPTHVAVLSSVAFPSEMIKPGKTVRAMVNGKMTYIDKSKVDYELPSASRLFTATSNLVPIMSAVNGPRLLMGAKYFTQALPLREPEAPWVQGLQDDGKTTFEEKYGEKVGAIKSEVAGRVVKITPDEISIRTPKGIVKIDTYNNLPLNRRTYISNIPLVQEGDHVEPGQLIAASNFTDKNGTLALGKNLRTAYMAWKGHNYEDAIVISDAAAKKLSSEHMYPHKVDFEKASQRGIKEFVSLFPSRFTKEQLAKIDDDGVVKLGAIVKPDDPLTLAVKEKPLTEIHRGHKPGWMDNSEVWNHSTDGVVTDVEKTRTGVRVSIKTYLPMQVGDKLVGRFGDKGTVSSIVPEGQMPVDKDGNPMEVILNPLGVVTRCYDDQTEFLTKEGWRFGKDIEDTDFIMSYDTKTNSMLWSKQYDKFHKAQYTGSMLEFKSNTLNFCVTPNHKIWSKTGAPDSEYKEHIAQELVDKCKAYIPVIGNGFDEISVENVPSFINKEKIELFAAFMGWYIAEGHSRVDEYKTFISQSYTANPEKVVMINDLLHELGFSFRYKRSVKSFVIYSGELARYCSQFGHCADKYVPAWIKQGSKKVKEAFLQTIWLGDGSITVHKHGAISKRYSSTSKKLVDDIQAMLIVMGIASSVYLKKEKKGKDSWVLRIVKEEKQTRELLHKNWIRKQYKGIIYCPTVSTGYILTRRNGTLTIAGNTNPAQLVELALGKIAAKTGKQIKVPGFMDESIIDYAINKLKEAGIPDTEDLEDPSTRRKLQGILTGNRFLMKLHHMSETKGAARSIGGYTFEEQPAKGGKEGGKRLGGMGINALISHGATEVLKDAKLIRGQRNDEYWKAFQQGFTPPSPEVPLVYKKFIAYLRGAGINVKKTGGHLNILALTDKDVDALSHGEIKEPKGVDMATMKELPSGLFDPSLTGGHTGEFWTHIKLDEPIPNPVMEEPIRRMLGLTQAQFEGILSGKTKLNDRVGGEAIKEALARINIKQMKALQESVISSGAKSKRDNAIKLLGYLNMMENTGLKPVDFMLTKIPIIPPKLRPIASTQQFTVVSDANKLYVELMKSNQALKDVKAELGQELAGDERLNLYNSFKLLTGLTDPKGVTSAPHHVGGLLKQVFGTSSPKYGMFQRRVLGGASDVTGLAVISPNPSLDMDHVGLPEEKAWTIFEPFIMRRLAKNGMHPTDALRNIVNKTNVAHEALLKEMEERPILINRAPTLHKYNIMAAYAIPMKSNTLQISPVVTPGFNADFDGDSMQYHVPASDEAVAQAKEKMLPSHNLFSIRNFDVHYTPTQEYLYGLYLASTLKSNKRPDVYVNVNSAVGAYKRGELNISDPIIIRGLK